jgi:hypothetical protein
VAFFVWVVSVVGIYVKKTCSMGCNFVRLIFKFFCRVHVLRWCDQRDSV